MDTYQKLFDQETAKLKNLQSISSSPVEPEAAIQFRTIMPNQRLEKEYAKLAKLPSGRLNLEEHKMAMEKKLTILQNIRKIDIQTSQLQTLPQQNTETQKIWAMYWMKPTR